MAITSFKVGKLEINGVELEGLNNMTLAWTGDTSETTTIGETYKTYKGLGKGWTVGGTLYYDSSATVQATLRTLALSGDMEIAEVKAYVDDTNYYTGAMLLTGFNGPTKAVNGIDGLSITMTGNGALDYKP